jgi:hypothetical protein
MWPAETKDIPMQINRVGVFNAQSIVPPALWQDEEAYLRRQLTFELQALQERVTSLPHEDNLSRHLILWLASFTQGVRLQEEAGQRVPLAQILERYTSYLQRFLKTSIPPFVPFDEEVLLGSDGHSYGKKFLAVYLYHERPEMRKRSPMEPGNPARFTVTRHRCAEEFVKWLKGRNLLLRSQELEADYQSLSAQRLLPPLPFPHQVAQEEEDAMVAAAIAEVEGIVPFAQEILGQYQAEMIRHDAEENARIAAAQAALEEARRAFLQEVERLENQIQREENHLHQNEQNIHLLQGRIEQAEAANLQIQQGIQKVQEALNRRERDSMGGFFQFAGSFAISLAVTLVIQQFAPGFSLAPTPGGGMLKYNIFF